MVKITLKIIIALSIVAAIGYMSYAKGLWRMNAPSRAEYPVHGIDVSHHQGDIDWMKIPQSRFVFAYIKATEGGDFKDTRFQHNRKAARAAGLEIGAYHFFTLCRPGAQQAVNFIGSVPADMDLPPAIDLEYVGNCKNRPSRKELAKELNDFMMLVQKQYSVEPILYTTYGFYRDYLQGTEFANYDLWVRDVWGAPDKHIFPNWAYWQYADNARIPGITGPVDLNVRK